MGKDQDVTKVKIFKNKRGETHIGLAVSRTALCGINVSKFEEVDSQDRDSVSCPACRHRWHAQYHF